MSFPSDILKLARPGYLANTHTNTWFGAAMSMTEDARRYKAQIGGDPRFCPSHSMTFVLDDHGNLCAGDVTDPKARWQSLRELGENMDSGNDPDFRLLRVFGATDEQNAAIAAYWNANILGKWYDVLAYPELIFEDETGWRFRFPDAGLAWSAWCTEGNAESVNSVFPGMYPMNARPIDEIELLVAGKLELVA